MGDRSLFVRTFEKHILRAIRQRCALRLDYEHAKATHEASTKPRPGPRQGARYTFQKHWISTGVASIAKGGRPRLHLFAAAPPSAPAEPGSVHLRVGVTLTPAKGKRPTKSAWALEAHDIGPGGTRKERLRARGAIATAATHPTHAKGTVAKRHTWQVATQVAAGKALHYAAQLRSKGRSVTISLPSATTARDLQPTRQGDVNVSAYVAHTSSVHDAPQRSGDVLCATWLRRPSGRHRHHLGFRSLPNAPRHGIRRCERDRPMGLSHCKRWAHVCHRASARRRGVWHCLTGRAGLAHQAIPARP